MAEPNRQLLARVWRPLLREFNSTIERACLRRDAYLDRVFAHEAEVLKDEIPCRNSPEARAYLQSKLEDLDRLPVNFSLSPDTIKAVNRACEELNVIRDCFINRVLFLLFADINTCEAVTGIQLRECLPDILGDHDRDYVYAPLWGGGLCAVSEIVSSDPFWALRNFIEHFRQQGDESVTPLHACLIMPGLFSKKPPGVIALNCYLPDEFIPGAPASKRALEELFGILGEPINENPRDPKLENERKKAQ
ncbi:MAG: hypothetical protein AAB403_17825 [Planctomycetota bacterium]